MKIAKRVLAIVMAIAMIGCLTAMAFAAEGPKFVLEADKPDADGVVAVHLYAVDATGFKSGKAKVSYDVDSLTYSYADPGEDATKVNNELKAAQNTYTGLDNEEVTGTVSYAFYFLDALQDKAGFDAQSKKKSCTINADKFECAVFYFDMNEGADPEQLVFSLDVEADGAAAATEAATVVLKEEVVETTTEAPVAETTTAVVETEAPTTKEANPNTGDKATGDNMALAAAAGVVALAGAAFIISKKRK